MKKLFYLIVIGFLYTVLYADNSITRGPDIGEIYFIGPTVTVEGIYRSTDFGETAVCMDSISEVGRICADLTTGSLYRTRMPDVLYYSNNYGQYGSWIFRSNDISPMNGGRTEGHIYDGIARHSEDYGTTFINHSYNGYFGSFKASEIDNEDNIGYALVSEYGVLDSLWLLISYDNYENLEIQHVFNFGAPIATLSRGYEEGELYLYTNYWGDGGGRKLRYSNNFGEFWELKNTFNCPNLPIRGLVGGRQPGELYMNVEYVQLMGSIKYTYIYHSLDYGETFTIYNPFSYGEEPIFANFEAFPTEGSAPLTVQFTDLSNGDVASTWEWDFDNDGTIDSYEQNPEYTYQDTGYYSVSLSVHPFGFHPATRYDYIHVAENNSSNEEQVQISKTQLSNYPNPFNPSTIINYNLPVHIEKTNIEIYNLKGQLVDKISINSQQTSVSWHAEDFSSGIYFYKLDIKNSPTQKMLLLK